MVNCVGGKSDNGEQDRKDTFLVSGLRSLNSDDAIYDVEHYRDLPGLELGSRNYNFGFRVQVEMSIWQLDIPVRTGEV